MSRQDTKSLLVKGGHLIDPAAKINAPMDVLLRDGRVAEVALPNKTRGAADEKFDARGLIVAPGLTESHDCGTVTKPSTTCHLTFTFSPNTT